MDGNAADLSALGHMNTVTDANASYLNRTFSAVRALSLFLPWVYYNRVSISYPRIIQFFTALRQSTNLPIGAAGFCWGGRHVIALSHGNETVNGQPLIDVGYTAHPSNLSLPADIEKVELPLAIDQGSADFVLNMAGVKTIRGIFERKNGELREEGKERPRFEIKVVDGAKHGFAVRCDMDNGEEAAQEQIAETHAVEWFGKWFAGTGSTT
ncbi:MAG: hypothetical protein LQ344_002606 [Seirophora lacunosa]|nr:MAG: hypothetical protein LQ344_002606 [Seirophora lacunosa]